MKTSSVKYALEVRVREKAKLLTALARDNMTHEAAQIANYCITSAERFIARLLEWMGKEYHSMNAEAGEGVDSTAADWLFICSAVKAIFRELHKLRTGGQLNTNPADQAWAMMGTLDLQQEMSDDFNTHRVVVKESYLHVQRNAVLKTDFTHQMEQMNKTIKRVENLANSANSSSQKNKDKNKDKDKEKG